MDNEDIKGGNRPGRKKNEWSQPVFGSQILLNLQLKIAFVSDLIIEEKLNLQQLFKFTFLLNNRWQDGGFG